MMLHRVAGVGHLTLALLTPWRSRTMRARHAKLMAGVSAIAAVWLGFLAGILGRSAASAATADGTDSKGRRPSILLILADQLGSHGQRLKLKPWEESIRVPGILRYRAKVKPGRTTEALLSHVDLAPTLLGLCGLAVPEDMQGTDLSGVALGQTAAGPAAVLLQIFVPYAGVATPRPWRGLRTRHDLYARTEDGPWLLYDLAEDPYELKNLIHDPPFAIGELVDVELALWMRLTGDSWIFNSMAPVEDKGRLYRFGTFYTIREYLDWESKHPEVPPKD
jgi:hypothetical protein